MGAVRVASWGMLTNEEHDVVDVFEQAQVLPALQGAPRSIAYGLGRSYGDVCLNPGGRLLRMQGLGQFIAFDEAAGLLTCAAGVTLADISSTFIPRGWRLGVVPGTEQVTVGGAIANDVHGKSHHAHGAFSRQVERFWLQRSDQGLLEVTRDTHPELFAATVGGIGLTGIIVAATLRLIPVPGPWIDSETIAFEGVGEFERLSDESTDWENTVSWIDCVSGSEARGLFTRGNFTAGGPAPKAGPHLAVPVKFPISAVNGVTLRAFNKVYFEAGKRKGGRSIQHYKPFFFPLDAIGDWNRVYGPRGFFQYQSVIPPESATEATKEMLEVIRTSGQGSFLAVLKRFGSLPSEGMLSFPRPGTTLAIDFTNLGERTHELMRRLDEVVIAAGGRLYLAKDARMSRAMFEVGYPRAAEFTQWRDPALGSAMSARLFGK